MVLNSQPISCMHLGQSGFRIKADGITIYIDPYLSDSVARLEGENLKRQVPVKIEPGNIHDADWVLITHIHLDHCDLDTLQPIYHASPSCRFVGTAEVYKYLIENGFSTERVVKASNNWLTLSDHIKIHATPAAHPTIVSDNNGGWQCAGYILEINGRRIYHSGDTFVVKELIDFLTPFIPFDVVMLPVNEHNYFRESANIIGNMGLRDAFGFAELLKAKKMIPIHWDMFLPNSVFKEEIELLHKLLHPSFELLFDPTEL